MLKDKEEKVGNLTMNKKVIQHHHIHYSTTSEKDIVVPVTKGEHYILTRLQWLKRVSPGFIQGLLFELSRKEQTKLE